MSRLRSLDVLRGLTVFGMILVNNGAGPMTFAPLQHSKWNGLTPCDLVFPFFLFMVGVSIYISLRRHAGEPGLTTKILKRTLIMFVIGVLLHGWEMLLNGQADIIPSHIRIWGVLQRIALCYCGASFLFLKLRGRHLWKVTITLLIAYAIILIVGNGYAEVAADNWLARVDRSLFGDHLYRKMLDGRSPVDPEGLVGVISGIAHTLLGVICGRALMTGDSITERIMKLLVIAMALGIVGFLLSFGLPLNKRIWSPSYVMVTCSMAAGLLGIFTWLIDMRGISRWSNMFQWFGMNALFIYIISEMLPPVFAAVGINHLIYDGWATIIPNPYFTSLCYALTYDALMALLAWILYKNKTYIKI